MKSLTLLTTLLVSASLASASPVPAPAAEAGPPRPPPAPKCGTCNPISGENHCDITTSCINTGSRFHCACRAGYKASKRNNDIGKQFRLKMPDYEFLVFTPEWTECNTLCDNPYGYSKELCKEVPIYDKCAV